MSLIETLVAVLIFSTIFVALLRNENTCLALLNKTQEQYREATSPPSQPQGCRTVSNNSDTSLIECSVIELLPQSFLISN